MSDDRSSDSEQSRNGDFPSVDAHTDGTSTIHGKVPDPSSPDRREFLGKATGLVAGAGATMAAWPFISSMNPSADVITKGVVEFDVSGIHEGDVRTLQWRGKPIFVLHRNKEQIAAMEASNGGKDPEPDVDRVEKPQWLVVIGICTHLGCVPNRTRTGWLCPCHGSVYDNSGRILHGPAPRNLEVPEYKFVDASHIIIGQT